jgi:hypothetical protein
MCTSLENLKQQGIEQGLKLGIEKMLRANYPVEEVSRIFEVPEQKILEIIQENNLH